MIVLLFKTPPGATNKRVRKFDTKQVSLGEFDSCLFGGFRFSNGYVIELSANVLVCSYSTMVPWG